MSRIAMFLLLGLALLPSLLSAQDCKLKFAVGYANASGLQIGLTEEQKKFWDHDGGKKFKGMCLDPTKPEYLIVWSDELSGEEGRRGLVDALNRRRSTGQKTNTGAWNTPGGDKEPSTDNSWTYATVYIRPSSAVREKARYWVLDASGLTKTTLPVLRTGEASQVIPATLAHSNGIGDKVSTSDMALTTADPTAALENALKWLKKEKKL